MSRLLKTFLNIFNGQYLDYRNTERAVYESGLDLLISDNKVNIKYQPVTSFLEFLTSYLVITSIYFMTYITVYLAGYTYAWLSFSVVLVYLFSTIICGLLYLDYFRKVQDQIVEIDNYLFYQQLNMTLHVF